MSQVYSTIIFEIDYQSKILESNMKNKTRREEIISAAKKLIIEKGYRKTSVEDITNETRMSKGNFYTYFRSKDSLICTLMSEKDDKFYKKLNEKIKYSKTLEEKIKNYVGHYLIIPVEDLDYMLVMITMIRSMDSIGKEILENIKQDKIRRKNEVIKILKEHRELIDISEENDFEKYSLLIFRLINSFYINNFHPLEKSGNISIEEVKIKASKMDFKYEIEFLTKIILKVIKK